MIKLSGTSLPRSLWFGFDVNVAQSRGECPGARTTFRDALLGGGISDEGAMDEFERTFVGGTRSMEAAEGGGRSAVPFVGRGGGGMGLKVGGFKRGGSSGDTVVSAGFAAVAGRPFFCAGFWARGTGLRSDGSSEGGKESDGLESGLREVASRRPASWKAELWPFAISFTGFADLETCHSGLCVAAAVPGPPVRA